MKKVIINWREKYLEIKGIYPHPDNTYDISFTQLNEGVEKWCDHLQEKIWWDEELEKDFINAVKEIKHGGK